VPNKMGPAGGRVPGRSIPGRSGNASSDGYHIDRDSREQRPSSSRRQAAGRNTGSTLNTLSLALASTRATPAPRWRNFAVGEARLPSGVPSEPEVEHHETAGSGCVFSAERGGHTARPPKAT